MGWSNYAARSLSPPVQDSNPTWEVTVSLVLKTFTDARGGCPKEHRAVNRVDRVESEIETLSGPSIVLFGNSFNLASPTELLLADSAFFSTAEFGNTPCSVYVLGFIAMLKLPCSSSGNIGTTRAGSLGRQLCSWRTHTHRRYVIVPSRRRRSARGGRARGQPLLPD